MGAFFLKLNKKIVFKSIKYFFFSNFARKKQTFYESYLLYAIYLKRLKVKWRN